MSRMIPWKESTVQVVWSFVARMHLSNSRIRRYPGVRRVAIVAHGRCEIGTFILHGAACPRASSVIAIYGSVIVMPGVVRPIVMVDECSGVVCDQRAYERLGIQI